MKEEEIEKGDCGPSTPKSLFLRFCRTWSKRYLITSQTRVKRVSRIHHRTILTHTHTYTRNQTPYSILFSLSLSFVLSMTLGGVFHSFVFTTVLYKQKSMFLPTCSWLLSCSLIDCRCFHLWSSLSIGALWRHWCLSHNHRCGYWWHSALLINVADRFCFKLRLCEALLLRVVQPDTWQIVADLGGHGAACLDNVKSSSGRGAWRPEGDGYGSGRGVRLRFVADKLERLKETLIDTGVCGASDIELTASVEGAHLEERQRFTNVTPVKSSSTLFLAAFRYNPWHFREL